MRTELAWEAQKRAKGKRWGRWDVCCWSYWIWEENEILSRRHRGSQVVLLHVGNGDREKEHPLRIRFENKLLSLSWLPQCYVSGCSQILSQDRHRHTPLKISKHCISAISLHHQDVSSNLPFRPLPHEFQAAFFEQTSCSVPFCSSLMYFKHQLLSPEGMQINQYIATTSSFLALYLVHLEQVE